MSELKGKLEAYAKLRVASVLIFVFVALEAVMGENPLPRKHSKCDIRVTTFYFL